MIVRKILQIVIISYQKWVSPLKPPSCRFYPSCSQYSLLCLEKYSLKTACLKTFLRLSKCNPIHPGGIDLP